MEGAVQGRNATHAGYAHLFKHIAPVAKVRRGTYRPIGRGGHPTLPYKASSLTQAASLGQTRGFIYGLVL